MSQVAEIKPQQWSGRSLDAESLLKKSVESRIPKRSSEKGADIPVTELADYMLDSAHLQGDLAQARLTAFEALRTISREWDHLKGYEFLRRGKSVASIQEAKRLLRPDLYDALTDAQWLVDRLTEEIDRLERDANKCSRVYTLLTGG